MIVDQKIGNSNKQIDYHEIDRQKKVLSKRNKNLNKTHFFSSNAKIVFTKLK